MCFLLFVLLVRLIDEGLAVGPIENDSTERDTPGQCIFNSLLIFPKKYHVRTTCLGY